MKASPRHALTTAGLVAAFAAGAAPSALDAQSRPPRTPPPDAPRFMVTVLRSAERGLGTQSADAIRSRLSQDFPFKELWVVPKNDINATLQASGYSTTEPLSPNDAKQLASLLRADEYLDATVTKTGGEFRIEPRLVLARDPALVQPLPAATGARMDLAAMMLSRELSAARRQLAHEKRCVEQARAGNYAEAVAAARQGVSAYANATLARLCMAGVWAAMKQNADGADKQGLNDSIIAVTREVLRIDPRSRNALALAAQAYKDLSVAAASDTARANQHERQAIEYWLELLGTDPRNVRLAQDIIAELARSGNAATAVPIINRIVSENPGDPELLRQQFAILYTVRDWKGAVQTGENLYRTDTTVTDSVFFIRLTGAYAADSQPQKAAEAVARGIAKYPGNATLRMLHAQTLRDAGQLAQAAEAMRQALRVAPNNERGWALLAQTYMDQGRPDSALSVLRTASTSVAGDTAKRFVAQYALKLGNDLYKAGVASKERADYQKAMPFLQLSDNTAASDEAKFLLGVTAFSIGQSAVNEANKGKSCELARLGSEMFTIAQINLPAGGKINPQAAGQLLQYLPQFMPVVEKQVKAYCK